MDSGFAVMVDGQIDLKTVNRCKAERAFYRSCKDFGFTIEVRLYAFKGKANGDIALTILWSTH